jgi:uncharacterized protein
VAVSVDVAIAVGLAGVVVGTLSALLGVGGGLIMVPLIVLLLGKSQHVAEGTSLLVIVPTALVGAVLHYREGFVSLRHSALLGASGIAGGYLGASLALGLAEERLQLIFGLFLLVMGGRSIQQGLRDRRGTPEPARRSSP